MDKFKGVDSPIKYFESTAKRAIDKCCRYFLSNPQKRADGREVYQPKDDTTSEKLLYVLTSLDIKLKSNIFQRMNPKINENDIPMSVSSPLPSMQLSG